jgi:plasmid stability protein
MTITIELPDDLAERLRARAAEAGQDINAFVIALLWERVRTYEASKADDV